MFGYYHLLTVLNIKNIKILALHKRPGWDSVADCLKVRSRDCLLTYANQNIKLAVIYIKKLNVCSLVTVFGAGI